MTYCKETHSFPSFYAGNKREIILHRFGNKETALKTYIQANLHADEAPGVLTVFHLIKMLKDADKKGTIPGEIIVVPSANPIGLGQWNHGRIEGRFDSSTGINFNRDFPDVTETVAEAIDGKLSSDPIENILLIKHHISKVIEALDPQNESEYLKKFLFSMAFDADIVLDLHCDFEAVAHIYLGSPLWESSKDLSRYMGAPVTLLAESSGGDPFDEACSKTYWELAEKFPDFPIPSACLSATLELRGRCDVHHDLAINDAKNIFHFLTGRDHIEGEKSQLPELINDATPLDGVQQVIANNAGVIVYLKEPGDHIAKGEVIAEIVNPIEDNITEVKSETDGIIFTRRANRLAAKGLILGRIAGKETLEGKGEFLLSP